MGNLAADRPAWWRWAYFNLFGALTKLKSAANDIPYTSQVALGLFGQCNAQASKVAHCIGCFCIYFKKIKKSKDFNKDH